MGQDARGTGRIRDLERPPHEQICKLLIEVLVKVLMPPEQKDVEQKIGDHLMNRWDKKLGHADIRINNPWKSIYDTTQKSTWGILLCLHKSGDSQWPQERTITITNEAHTSKYFRWWVIMVTIPSDSCLHIHSLSVTSVVVCTRRVQDTYVIESIHKQLYWAKYDTLQFVLDKPPRTMHVLTVFLRESKMDGVPTVTMVVNYWYVMVHAAERSTCQYRKGMVRVYVSRKGGFCLVLERRYDSFNFKHWSNLFVYFSRVDVIVLELD